MSYCDRRLLLPFWFASMRHRHHALVVQRAHHQGRGVEEVEGITRVQLNMFCSHSTAHSCQPTCHPARRARPDPPPRPPADLHPLLRQTQFRSRLDRHCSGGASLVERSELQLRGPCQLCRPRSSRILHFGKGSGTCLVVFVCHQPFPVLALSPSRASVTTDRWCSTAPTPSKALSQDK